MCVVICNTAIQSYPPGFYQKSHPTQHCSYLTQQSIYTTQIYKIPNLNYIFRPDPIRLRREIQSPVLTSSFSTFFRFISALQLPIIMIPGGRGRYWLFASYILSTLSLPLCDFTQYTLLFCTIAKDHYRIQMVCHKMAFVCQYVFKDTFIHSLIHY